MRIRKRYKEETQEPAVKLAVVGKIRIGTKSDKGTPVSLDYFKPDADAQYLQLFTDAYGAEPKSLTITFLSDDLRECCRHYYELRDTKGGRVAYGDGVEFFVATPNGGAVIDVLHTPEDTDAFMDELAARVNSKWRERLTLRFALPQVPVLGVWQFSTHGSGTTIPNILGTIDLMKNLAGRIVGIPFDLKVEKVKSDKAGSRSVFPIVSLVPNISTESAAIVRSLPVQLGSMLTEKRIAELAAGEHTTTEYDPGELAEFEELPAEPDEQGPDEQLRDKIEQCLTYDALGALYQKDVAKHSQPGIKKAFAAQKAEITRLIKAGQIKQ